MLPGLGPFRWSFRWLALVFLAGGLAAAGALARLRREPPPGGRPNLGLWALAGVAGSPSVVTYAGAKAYSQIFSEGLWWELKQKGVDVLHVVVGKTDTPAMERLGIDHGDEGDSPRDVALQALTHLADGPVTVMPKMQEGFVQLCTPDRRAVTLGNASFIMSSTEGTWEE